MQGLLDVCVAVLLTTKSVCYFFTSAVSHDGGWRRGTGWQLHTEVLPSQRARCQTRDRGLRPGPELFWKTKNESEIPTQKKTRHKNMLLHKMCLYVHENVKQTISPSLLKARRLFACLLLSTFGS